MIHSHTQKKYVNSTYQEGLCISLFSGSVNFTSEAGGGLTVCSAAYGVGMEAQGTGTV